MAGGIFATGLFAVSGKREIPGFPKIGFYKLATVAGLPMHAKSQLAEEL